MCLRAKIIDTFVSSVLNNEQDSVVMHLGRGLFNLIIIYNPD
jgi:hypothetical protein